MYLSWWDAKNISGGRLMEKETLWQMFLATGSPEVYLMYHQSKPHTEGT